MGTSRPVRGRRRPRTPAAQRAAADPPVYHPPGRGNRRGRRGAGRARRDRPASLPAPEPPPNSELLAELLDGNVLSPASRAVLVLHFQEDMELAEVAAVLEIPLGTVKSRLAYGLKTLRRYLEEKRS